MEFCSTGLTIIKLLVFIYVCGVHDPKYTLVMTRTTELYTVVLLGIEITSVGR